VLDLTGGQGVDVVFDAVGAVELRPKSRRRAWFGVFNAYSQPAMWACGVANLVPLVASGAVDPYITGVYTREPAPEAHRLLEGRQSQGKLALVHPN
jgi:NADPH:quinone reductase-like Zn-dependent oxidoreductase